MPAAPPRRPHAGLSAPGAAHRRPRGYPELSWQPLKRDDAGTNKRFVRCAAFACITWPSRAGKSDISADTLGPKLTVSKEYGGLRVNHLKRLKALELENSRLRTVVADQALALVGGREAAGKAD